MKIDVKEKRKFNSVDSRLIQAIYDKFGGSRRSAKICGYSVELLSMWKKNGKVPLKKLAEISEKLECSPFDLNKKELTRLIDVINKWRNKEYGRTE